MKPRIIPEFKVRTRRIGAGFVPGMEDDVEIVQFWCRNAETGDERRATSRDAAAAGLVRKQKRRGK